jgi:DNA-binding IclR family transcriptional regulator
LPGNESSIQVMDKVSSILDELACSPSRSAAELASLIGEPRSSVYRILASLQHHGLVEAGPRRGSFQLGVRFLRLGAAVTSRFREREAALPTMERMHARTGETVFLCIRRGFQAVCIERLDGERVQSLALRLGGSLPLHVGGAPTCLLAYEPESFWSTYLTTVKPGDPHSGRRMKLSQLREVLHGIREQGFSISDEDVTVGIAAVGAPVFDYHGNVCAALSLSGTKPAILSDDFGRRAVEITVAGAEEVSRALGFRPDDARPGGPSGDPRPGSRSGDPSPGSPAGERPPGSS